MNLTFIGLGGMGTTMVERLLLANYEVTVFNRTMENAQRIVLQRRAQEGLKIGLNSFLGFDSSSFISNSRRGCG